MELSVTDSRREQSREAGTTASRRLTRWSAPLGSPHHGAAIRYRQILLPERADWLPSVADPASSRPASLWVAEHVCYCRLSRGLLKRSHSWLRCAMKIISCCGKRLYFRWVFGVRVSQKGKRTTPTFILCRQRREGYEILKPTTKRQ